METSGLTAAILKFPLPVTCIKVGNEWVKKFDPENGEWPLKFFVLSPTEAEIPLGVINPPWALNVMAAILNFHFRSRGTVLWISWLKLPTLNMGVMRWNFGSRSHLT